jgi:hypothetical protein
MNKNIIIVVLIVVILAIGSYFIFIKHAPDAPIAPESTTKPKGLKTPVLPAEQFMANFKTGCEIESQVNAEKAWIHACYLKDLLTPSCKQIFNIDGYYLYDNDSDKWIKPMVTDIDYLEAAALCGCKLPNDIATELNSNFQNAMLRCSRLPN